MENKLVSIVLPTYKREERLKLCLKRIFDNTVYQPYEIIIVINEAISDKYRFLDGLPNVRFYFNGENNGAIFSWHRGIDLSKGEYLVWLNDDVEVCPRWLQIGMYEMNIKLQGNGMIGFYDGFQDFYGALFLIYKELYLKLKPEGYKHYGIDFELTKKANDLGKYYKSKLAMVLHYHPGIFPFIQSDETYQSESKYLSEDNMLLIERLNEKNKSKRV